MRRNLRPMQRSPRLYPSEVCRRRSHPRGSMPNDPPVSVATSEGGVSQTGRRNGHRGAKRQPGGLLMGGRGQAIDGGELAGAWPVKSRHRSKQSHSVGMPRPLIHRVGGAFLHKLAGIHDGDAMRVARDNAEIVGDQDQRDSRSRDSFCISSRICAWIVTSSAVVGSSAMMSFGLHASPIAIMTRWRMPPEN